MKKRFANKISGFYTQKYIEIEKFKGYVCSVKLNNITNPKLVEVDNEKYYISNNNYLWIEIYPLDENYCITVMYDENNNLIQYYFDIAKSIGFENGIPYEEDLYLDLVIRPNKKYYILDEDELINAYDNKIINSEDKNLAYTTLEKLIDMFGKNYDYLECFVKELIKNAE